MQRRPGILGLLALIAILGRAPGRTTDVVRADPPGASPPAQPARSPDVRRVRPASAVSADLPSLFPFGARGLDHNPTQKPWDLVDGALRWLAPLQRPDGSWPALEGKEQYVVGITGLALLTFLGAGHIPGGGGRYADTLDRGLAYLRGQQDPEGCLGPRSTGHYVYNHAFAALALVEAAAMSGAPDAVAAAQSALNFVAMARNPYFAWRYGVMPGDNDTSVTASMWSVLHAADFANRAALRAGLPAPFRIDTPGAFEGTAAWMKKMTDPTFGRAGYQQRGAGNARPAELVDRFPTEKSEAMTAAAAWFRLATAGGSSLTSKSLNLLLGMAPNADDLGAIDFYYWHYGSLAMSLAPASLSAKWFRRLDAALGTLAIRDGTGISWKSTDPWTADGGFVYSTAMAVLSIEARWRYLSPPDGRDITNLLSRDDVDPIIKARVLRWIGLRHATKPAVSATLVARELASPHPATRRAAALALASLGGAGPSIPALAKLLQDPDPTVVAAAVQSLGTAGKAGGTALAAAYSHASPIVRAAAFDAAAAIGKGSGGGAAARTALADPEPAVRVAAAGALWKTEQDAAAATPVLTAALEAPDEPVRLRAIQMISNVGAPAAAAETALLAVTQTGVPALRVEAALALFAVRGRARPETAPLTEALSNEDPFLRERAAQCLGELGSEGGAAARLLAASFSDPDPVVRLETARALGQMGREARDALPDVDSARFDPDPLVAQAATEALAALEPASPPAAVPGPPTAPPSDVATLGEALRHASSAAAVRGSVLTGLAKSGPWLVDLARSGEAIVRIRALEFLGDVGEAAARFRSTASDAAHDADGGVRASALRALGRMAPLDPALQTLLAGAAVTDPDSRARRAGLTGVLAAEKPSPAALDLCARVLNESNASNSTRALEALARWHVGATDESWAMTLARTTAGTSPAIVRVMAYRALGDVPNSTSKAFWSAVLEGTGWEDGVTATAWQAMIGAVTKRDPKTGEALVTRWRQADPPLRARLARAIQTAGDDCVQALVTVLGGPDLQLSAAAANVLGEMATTLVAHSKEILEAASRAADASLPDLGPGYANAPGGIDALVAGLRSPSVAVRTGAARVARHAAIQGVDEDARKALRTALQSAYARESDASAKAAEDLAVKSMEAYPGASKPR